MARLKHQLRGIWRPTCWTLRPDMDSQPLLGDGESHVSPWKDEHGEDAADNLEVGALAGWHWDLACEICWWGAARGSGARRRGLGTRHAWSGDWWWRLRAAVAHSSAVLACSRRRMWVAAAAALPDPTAYCQTATQMSDYDERTRLSTQDTTTMADLLGKIPKRQRPAYNEYDGWCAGKPG